MKKLFLVSLLLALVFLPLLVLGEQQAELTLTIKLDKDTVAVSLGESVTATLTTAGGTGPYVYSYYWLVIENDSELYGNHHYNVSYTTDTFWPRFGQSGRLRAQVWDSEGSYTFAEVPFTITGSPVLDPLELSISSIPATVDISTGESITATLVATGGTGPYKYSYSWGVTVGGNERVERSSYKVSSDTDTFKPVDGQSGRLQAKVTDSVGRVFSVEATFTITGSLVADPLTLSIKLSQTTVDVSKGESVTATLTAVGGQGPYTYDFYWYLIEKGYEDKTYDGVWNVTSNKHSFKPLFGQSGLLVAFVEDSAGNESRAQTVFAVTGSQEAELLKLTFSLDKTTADISKDESFTATLTASGGQGPYLYTFDWRVTNEGTPEEQWRYKEDILSNIDSFKPICGQSGICFALVRDSVGRYTASDQWFTLIGGPDVEPLKLDISLDKTTVDIGKGESVTAILNASDGLQPYTFSYNWYVTRDGEEEYVTGEWESLSNTISFKPRFGESGCLRVSAGDAARGWVQAEATFTITGTVPAPGDANGDSTIDIMDLVSIIDYIVSGTDTTSLANADANGDGTVDIMDLVWIIDMIVGG